MPDFEMYLNAIQKRKSIRNYQEQPLSDDHNTLIREMIQDPSLLAAPFGHDIQFQYLEESSGGVKKRFGTYGFVKNSQGFVFGKCINHPSALFDFGYLFEKIILKLTHLGIGTCWLAGTFDRNDFLDKIELNDKEIIPAISPVGYAREKEHFKSGIQRQLIGADRRKHPDRLFYTMGFDHPFSDSQSPFQSALEAVRQAPSAKNRQPWRIVISDDKRSAHFFIANKHDLEKAFACQPEYLDLGIAACHFDIAMRANGLAGEFIQAQPEWLLIPMESIEYIATWKMK